MSKTKKLSDLTKFVITSNKLPKLLEMIKLESEAFGCCLMSNKEIVSEGYANSIMESAALISVLVCLNIISVSYDVSDCGEFVLCRYMNIVD